MNTHDRFSPINPNKLTNRVARKPRVDIYKEFLSRKTIYIHADNPPFFDKLTRYSPPPPPRPFTLRNIPDHFCRCPPDSPPQPFSMCLIPDWFGDFPT